jgi:uroporphyrinogen decarboxylase
MFDHGPGKRKALMGVLQGEDPWRRPIWFMRQAGRYLPEYRKVRGQAGSFLNLCFNPELACEVTLQPLRRFDLDAAILFADILLLPMGLGQKLEFRQNEGPVLEPIRSLADLRATLNGSNLSQLESVFETVSRVSGKLPAHVSLIGFCGAPWTVASYMVEGGTSSDRGYTRVAAFDDADWLNGVIEVLVEHSVDYLCRQIEAGAEAVQIFDTWASDLPDGLREKYCFEPIRQVTAAVKDRHPNVPVIGFARGLGACQLEFARVTGVDAIGVEATFPIASDSCGLTSQVVVQGNVDPLVLLAKEEGIRRQVLNVLENVDASRHIMNLGHGIRPETKPEHVGLVVDIVREFDSRV